METRKFRSDHYTTDLIHSLKNVLTELFIKRFLVEKTKEIVIVVQSKQSKVLL